jgi:hypothetical protein
MPLGKEFKETVMAQLQESPGFRRCLRWWIGRLLSIHSDPERSAMGNRKLNLPLAWLATAVVSISWRSHIMFQELRATASRMKSMGSVV